jgi:uncharacterized membrane protein HdeD (DUF308 family)
MLDFLLRNWWVLLVRGIFAIIFGVLAFAMPATVLAALVVVFGVYALLDGLVALGAALMDREVGRPRWLVAVAGAASVAAGLISFAWPGVTAMTLLYLIATWAVVTGVLQIVAAFELHDGTSHWPLAVGGALSILFGGLLAVRPFEGMVGVVYVIGAYAIVYGLTLLVAGVNLASLRPGVHSPT